MMSSSQSGSVSMLPGEVLGHIFELGFHSQEDRGNSPWNFSFSRCCEYQVSVSHVSRHFRNVAIHTPRLWSIIHPQGNSLESDVAYVKTCFERSGSLLCTISLNYEDLKFSCPNLAICEIMTLVNSNIYRLERFFAKSPQIPILHQIMGYLNKPAPRLTALELSYTPFPWVATYYPDKDDFQLLLFGGQMPMLTTILLEGVSALRWPGYRLENITELGLSFEGKSMHRELRTLIKRVPLLRKLGIRGASLVICSRQTEGPYVLELNFLEYLEVSYLGQADAIRVISLIQAPILKSLILAGISESDRNCSALLDVISTQPLRFPSLVSLLLEDLGASNEAFADLLRVYPNLEDLGASNEAFADLLRVYPNLEWLGMHMCGSRGKEEQEFVDVLEDTKSTGSLRLCPKLKTLRCYGVDLEHIQDVLARRAEANIPLPKLELSKYILQEPARYDSLALTWLQENTRVEFLPLVLNDY